jgi:hypothetical protein
MGEWWSGGVVDKGDKGEVINFQLSTFNFQLSTTLKPKENTPQT